ncbi:MAG: N-acyl-D-aspartate/D-glutamate deacylase [Woeseiaceae bacterium]
MFGTTYLRIILALVVAMPLLAAAQETYDVVINNGRVMDPETDLDGIRNIGIRGQSIVEISQSPLQGTIVIDASGLVVAPGFIDLHAHGQSTRANEFQAMDGVTTALELEGGVFDVGEFLASRSGTAVVNYGASIGHGYLRTWAMPEHADTLQQAADAYRSAAPGDITARTELAAAIDASRYDEVAPGNYPVLWRQLETELKAGGLGVGMPHQYYPGVSYDEIFRLFQFAAEQDVPIYTHVREMGVAPMQEVIANAAATGASLHIVHMNSSSLWDYQTNLDLILGAQERGVDVTTEAYPYTAASTGIKSAIFDDGWQDRLQISYEDLQWQDSGERLTEETFNSYREEGGILIIHMMKPEWISAMMADPRVMVASDGMPYAPGAHPRGAGTFSRFLGRYVRGEALMSLMDGLKKITLMPAQRLENISPQMKRKGRIQIGSDADITIFDAEHIIDTADFEHDLSYSEGVEFVLVNGKLVVRDGSLVEGARPGQAVLGRHIVR